MIEKEIREEYKDPTFDLVSRTRGEDWIGPSLRTLELQADNQIPSTQIMIASVQAKGWEGGLLKDAAVKDHEKTWK